MPLPWPLLRRHVSHVRRRILFLFPRYSSSSPSIKKNSSSSSSNKRNITVPSLLVVRRTILLSRIVRPLCLPMLPRPQPQSVPSYRPYRRHPHRL
jgi:hypothetical protein